MTWLRAPAVPFSYSMAIVTDGVGVGVSDTVTVGVGVAVGGGVAAGPMTMLSVTEAAVPAVAVTVAEYVPAVVGVPLIVPAELIASPGGSPEPAQVIVPVPPVAARVAL